MLLAYSTYPAIQKIIRASAGADVVIASDWRQVQKRIGDASCLIIHLEPLHSETLGNFCLLKARLALLPVVAIAEHQPTVAIALRDVVIEELIWTQNVSQQLQPSVQHALSKARFNRIATAVRANIHLTHVTRDFLTTALLARKPFRTIEDVAVALGVNSKTIHNHWHESGVADLSPKNFLDWIILLRADALRASGLSWSAVTSRTGVHQHTLARAARRLTGRPLSSVISSSSSTIEAEFSQKALPPLFGTDIPELLNFSAICHYV
jgi:hypothetical protein